MRLQLNYLGWGGALVLGLAGCGGAGGEEPSEAQMKEAMLYAMNHPPGITNSEPISIKFFKKEACDKPTPQGYNCTFDVQVASANIGASRSKGTTRRSTSATTPASRSRPRWAIAGSAR